MANQNETKRIPAINAEINGNNLLLTFANGNILTMDAGTLSNEIAAAAIMHGLKQKLVDAAAIARNPETGRSATIEDKYEAVKTVYDRLLSGLWNAPRGEGGAPSGGYLLQALCRLYPAKSVENLRAFLEGKTDKEKAALRKNPRVAEIIEAIKAENAKPDENAGEDLLSELED
jgi:hypothetical protein